MVEFLATYLIPLFLMAMGPQRRRHDLVFGTADQCFTRESEWK
jgi:hypothetical protein